MEIEDKVRRRIVRNIFLSLLIYAMPVMLMFLSFLISGKRPWKHTKNNVEKIIKSQK
ncbi:hypothetical protein SAMN05216436_12362 [bacterium A37T11]|nr:hypothetical protein SAMN05216436_12362 [bacterium A37T11]